MKRHHHVTSACAALLGTSLTLAGCDGLGSSGPATRVDAYNLLVNNANHFYAAFMRKAVAGEPVQATAPEEVTEEVGYAFSDGVRLAEFSSDGQTLCLTGPIDTYTTLTLGESFTRTLGAGECDYSDGTIVLSTPGVGGDDHSHDHAPAGGTVTKGADLASEVEGLDQFSTIVQKAIDEQAAIERDELTQQPPVSNA